MKLLALLLVIIGVAVGGYLLSDRENRLYKKATKLISPLIADPKVNDWVKEPYSGSLERIIDDPQWNKYPANGLSWSVKQGSLNAKSIEESVWWKNWRGPGLFTYVKGDVDVSIAVRTRKASNDSLPLEEGFQFGGLMLRDPKSNKSLTSENYVFNVIGQRGQYGKQVETKSTEFGWSYVEGHDWPSGDAELRIVRKGPDFSMYARESGHKEWILKSSMSRPDLPEILELGIIAYAFDYWTGSHDLSVFFDRLDINF